MKWISDLPRAPARRRSLTRDRSGTAALETALVATPLFAFVLTIINAGQVLWLQNALDISVTDAARCASIAAASSGGSTSCGTPSQIAAYAAGRSGAGFDSSIFSSTQENCGSRVSATYPLSLRLPFVSYSLNLSAQACYPS